MLSLTSNLFRSASTAVLLSFTLTAAFAHSADVRILPLEINQAPLFSKEVRMDASSVSDLLAQSVRPVEQALPKVAAANPLIHKNEKGEMVVSDFLKNIQNELLIMNDVSYNLVKGGKFTAEYLREADRLKKLGWEIYTFNGLEGTFSSYHDTSGFVAYNAERNILTVVYHGTANNSDGWATNFDASKMNAWALEAVYIKDTFDHLAEQLEALYKKSEKDPAIKAIRKMVSDLKMKPGTMTVENIQMVLDALRTETNLRSNSALESLRDYCSDKLRLIASLAQVGANISGTVHSGFLKKYISTKAEVLEIIKEIMNKIPADRREATRIVFTGHSQAGATANLALADLCANHGKELFGDNFDNKKTNNFVGYFLSAARAGDKAYKKWFHNYVGEANAVRHNVMGDPVPVAAGDTYMAKLLRKIPALGVVLQNYAGYDDTGLLFLDNANDAWLRARALHKKAGKDVEKMDDFEVALRYLATWAVDEDKIPDYVLPKRKSTSFWSSPLSWVSERWHGLKLVLKLKDAASGDKKALKEIEQMVNDRFGHLHHGFHRADLDASTFSPWVVSTDLDKLLNQGYAHMATKTN